MAMSKVYGVITILAVIIILDVSNGACPSGWLHFENSCYFFSHTREMWITAEEICRTHSARLAEIYTKSLSDFLSHKVTHLGHEYWVGGRDDVIEGVWQWASTSQNVTFTNWALGKPNNNHDSDCLALDKIYHGKWNDNICHNEYRYICEQK